MGLGNRVYRLLDDISRRIPSAFLRIFAMPINYQINSKDSVVYESARMINIAFAFCMNNKIEGDYAEFGVFEGRTTIEAYRTAKRYGFSKMKFWIFDSFSGLPEIKGIDAGGPFVQGEFACTRNYFEHNLRHFGVDLNQFKIVEGFYEKTLPDFSQSCEKIAVAWIDCDLFESTVPVLNFLTNRLVNGSVLIFDDWFCFDGGSQKGEQLACAEWLERNPNIKLIEYRRFHWAGNSFIVSRS